MIATFKTPLGRWRQRCLSAEAFFAGTSWLSARSALAWKAEKARILLHGHCHQKALWGTADTLKLLRAIPGADVAEMNTGCCGVAGSFGYEHYDLSMKIAEDRLLPTIRENPDAIYCRARDHLAAPRLATPATRRGIQSRLCLTRWPSALANLGARCRHSPLHASTGKPA